jgi:RHS repeat-associated protein
MGYGGMEKDGETNFTNFELRQYDPRLGRWFNPDPMGQYYSPYLSMGNNPVSFIDPTGGAANEFNQDEYEANLSFDFGGAGWFEGQFGQNYQHGGASYGSVTASGQFYSDYEQINDASAIQEKKNKKKAEEEAKKKPDPNSQIPGREPDPIIEGVLLPTFDYDENGRWLYDVHALVQSVFDNMQYYSSFAKDGVLYLNGIGKADLGDYMGVRVMATGVPVQDVYDMQKILRDREIWAQYGKNFNDLADASETAVIIGACVVGGAAGILVATEVGLVAIVVESKVIQKIVRIGSKFKTTGFEKMGFKDLQALTKTHSKELNAFFKSGGKGNIAKEALQSYKELATRMVNGTGGAYQKVTAEAAKLHMERIEMINNALKNM